MSGGNPVDFLSEDFVIWRSDFSTVDWRQDPEKWEKTWETILDSVTSRNSVEVFQDITTSWDETDEVKDQAAQLLREDCIKSQSMSVEWLTEALDVLGRTLETVWLLLPESKHKEHVLEGLIFACEATGWLQDARPLCPELTVSKLIADRGQAMLNFVGDFLDANDFSEDPDVFVLSSPWWDVLWEDLPQPVTRRDIMVYECLTLIRNDFISRFVFGWLKSFTPVLADESGEMADIVRFLLKRPLHVARSVARTHLRMQPSPVPRCENCCRTAEELKQGTHFMFCGACKTALGAKAAYCSRECQKEDWPRHKRTCGKTLSKA